MSGSRSVITPSCPQQEQFVHRVHRRDGHHVQLLQFLDDLIAKVWPDYMKDVLPETQMNGGKINGVQYGIPSAYAPSKK